MDGSLATVVAGVVAAVIGALVTYYLGGLREKRKQEHERGLAQDIALKAYYEQIGQLLTEHDLRNTDRMELRELARSHTLTALRELDGKGKGSLLTFLYGAGLIEAQNPAVALTGAELQGVDLQDANLQGANLQRANLQGANLQGAFLIEANLQEANLYGAYLIEAFLIEAYLQEANLYGAYLQGANLYGAKVTDEQLANRLSLQGTTMPDGQEYKDWLKDKEGSGKDVETE